LTYKYFSPELKKLRQIRLELRTLNTAVDSHDVKEGIEYLLQDLNIFLRKYKSPNVRASKIPKK
jgi:hypothetical protein